MNLKARYIVEANNLTIIYPSNKKSIGFSTASGKSVDISESSINFAGR